MIDRIQSAGLGEPPSTADPSLSMASPALSPRLRKHKGSRHRIPQHLLAPIERRRQKHLGIGRAKGIRPGSAASRTGTPDPGKPGNGGDFFVESLPAWRQRQPETARVCPLQAMSMLLSWAAWALRRCRAEPWRPRESWGIAPFCLACRRSRPDSAGCLLCAAWPGCPRRCSATGAFL